MSIYSQYSNYNNRDYFSKYKKDNDFNSSSLSNVYRDLMGADKKSSFSSNYGSQRSLSEVDMRSNYHYSNNNDQEKRNNNYDQQLYKNPTPSQNQKQFNYSVLTNNVARNFLNNNNTQERNDQFYSNRNSFRNRSDDSRYNNNSLNNYNNYRISNVRNSYNRNLYDTISGFGPSAQNENSNSYNNNNQRNINIYSRDTLGPNNKSSLVYKNYFGENKSPNIYNNNNNNISTNNYNLRYSYATSTNSTNNRSSSQGFSYNRNNNDENSPYKNINNNYYNNNNTIKSANINRLSNKMYNNNFSLYDNNNNNNNSYDNSQRNSLLYNSSQRSSLYNSSQKTSSNIISYGVHTMAGTNCFGVTKTNQDSYLVKVDKNSYNNYEYNFGVFDGHGSHGHFVSQAIKQFLNSLPPYDENVTKSTFLNIFQKLSNNINNSNYFESICSGSTVVIVYINYPKIVCINCGDSRAILITKNNNIISLSNDHKPELPEERIRIEKMGGRIDKINGVGPFRVWYKNEDYPGLAMSRSIGDQLAHKVGVSDEPEIKEYDAEDVNALAVVVASDGVWEFMSNEEVKNIVMNYEFSKNASDCAKSIVEKAREVWKRTGYNIDDITAVVAFFG